MTDFRPFYYSIVKLITIFLIGIAVGSMAMFLFISPKIAQLKAEVIKIEAFSECVQSKIMGIGKYEELIFVDVISCVNFVK